MLGKYYAPVHVATAAQSNTYSPYFLVTVENFLLSIPFHEQNYFALERCHHSPPPLMNEIYNPCLMCDEKNIDAIAPVLSYVAWALPPRSDSSPPCYLPPRQPGLRNRSLFKSFMSTPQKRRACRKLRDRNEECVIVPLICDDL